METLKVSSSKSSNTFNYGPVGQSIFCYDFLSDTAGKENKGQKFIEIKSAILFQNHQMGTLPSDLVPGSNGHVS